MFARRGAGDQLYRGGVPSDGRRRIPAPTGPAGPAGGRTGRGSPAQPAAQDSLRPKVREPEWEKELVAARAAAGRLLARLADREREINSRCAALACQLAERERALDRRQRSLGQYEQSLAAKRDQLEAWSTELKQESRRLAEETTKLEQTRIQLDLWQGRIDQQCAVAEEGNQLEAKRDQLEAWSTELEQEARRLAEETAKLEQTRIQLDLWPGRIDQQRTVVEEGNQQAARKDRDRNQVDGVDSPRADEEHQVTSCLDNATAAPSPEDAPGSPCETVELQAAHRSAQYDRLIDRLIEYHRWKTKKWYMFWR